MPGVMNRRDALKAAFGAALPAALFLGRPQQGPSDSSIVSRLQMPDLGGRPLGPITDYDNDPRIIAIEKKIRCQCGCNLDVYTCRTTDFNCTTSPKMHAEVVALYRRGDSAQQILNTFVAENGQAVLMAPPARGFNLIAYLFPGVVILIVGAVLAFVLMRRQRGAAMVAAATEPEPGALDPAEAERLRAELERLER
ncbi:MAG TPA: cytochrome c-type biogenesis protein CcmH [Gemmatimonadales bacterium]|nr:cytochrome c-type biogenesis protein CcmH [Gemmatimonadales bacterium]